MASIYKQKQVAGFARWEWEDTTVPTGGGSNGSTGFDGSVNTISLDQERQDPQVYNVFNDGKYEVRFHVIGESGGTFNKRAELGQLPYSSGTIKPIGTKDWIGWYVRFADDYNIDPAGGKVNFWQCHPGNFFDNTDGPAVSLFLAETDGRGAPGQVMLNMEANGGAAEVAYPEIEYGGSPLIPVAGDTLYCVIQVIWGRSGQSSNGFFELKIAKNDGPYETVYSQTINTCFSSALWGGGWKVGIYKPQWDTEAGVDESAAAMSPNPAEVQTFIGTVRSQTTLVGDEDYNTDYFDTVDPKQDDAETPPPISSGFRTSGTTFVN